MAKYDLRIILEDIHGMQRSYISRSFFNSDDHANYALSSSEAVQYLQNSVSCSTHLRPKSGGETLNTSHIFKNNPFIK